MKDPQTVQQTDRIGFRIKAGTPEELAAFQRGRIECWHRVVQQERITAE